MIFVTVGTQFPFDRLVRVVDAWAIDARRDDVLAQVGESDYKPEKLHVEAFLTADTCDRRLRDAELVVCHAGMGTVLTCLNHGTRVIVMPRRANLGEHRNDHQLDTVAWMRELSGVRVVQDVKELRFALDHFADGQMAAGHLGDNAEPALLDFLRESVAAPPEPAFWRGVRRRCAAGLAAGFRWMLPEPKHVGQAQRAVEVPAEAEAAPAGQGTPGTGSAVSSAA